MLAIIGAGVLAAATLGGCTAVRFGYNQGPELAYWWFDRYVDFTDEQSPQVRAALADWFAWHRRAELPAYAALAERVRGDLPQPATPASMCRWFDDIRSRTDVALERALPSMAAVAMSMTPAQIDHLGRQYRKRNAERRDEFAQADPRQRRDAAVERAIERFERFYGRLDDAQRAVIAQGVAESPFDPDRWLAEREARQQEVLQTLQRLRAPGISSDEAVASLRTLVQRIQASPDEAYRQHQRRLVEFNCAFAARVHNATTPVQREAAARRFKGWEDDFRALASAGGTPTQASMLVDAPLALFKP
jgi:uncharacterized protein YoaH (UPF0181 family)